MKVTEANAMFLPIAVNTVVFAKMSWFSVFLWFYTNIYRNI